MDSYTLVVGEIDKRQTKYHLPFFSEVFLLVKFFRKLYRTSQGYHAVAIPQPAAAALGLEAGGMVRLDVKNGRVVITPVKEVGNGRT